MSIEGDLLANPPAELLAKLQAEADKANAEAAVQKILARYNEALAEQQEIVLRSKREEETNRLQGDDHHRVYRFAGAVNAASAAACIAKLNLWHRLDPECDIEIVFNSPGGSVIDGMALYDQIRAFSRREGGSHHITIGSRGYAASMAGILLQSGDTRWLGRNSYLMIHEISAGASGKIGELEDSVEFFKRICEQVVEIFVGRSGGKISKANFKKKWERQDWWLTASDALNYGFIDHVG